MRLRHDIPEHLFAQQGEMIADVLRRAVRSALSQHKRAGNPVATMRDNQVVILAPEQIAVDDNGDDASRGEPVA